MKKIFFLSLIAAAVYTLAGCGASTPSAPVKNSPTQTGTITESSTITVTHTVSPTFTDTPTITVSPTCTTTPYYMTIRQNVSGYTGSVDNCIYESTPEANYGGSAYAFIGTFTGYQRRVIVKYDLSTLFNSGNSVVKAVLKYTLNNISGSDFTITPYSLTRDWVAGTCSGTGCNNAGSCWNNYDTGLAWTTAGGDYGEAAGEPCLMNVLVSAAVPRYVTLSADTVNSWIQAPASNHGLILFTADSGINSFITVYMNEDVESNRPLLELYYY